MSNGLIKLTIPPSFRKFIEALGKEATPAIRAAMRAAMSPARAHMKALINTDTMQSDQSTGATYRAVVSKHGQSRTNRNVFYAMVGVSRRVSEDHYLPGSPQAVGQRVKLKQGRATGRGLYALQAKYKFNKRKHKSVIKTKQVFSRLKTLSLSKNDRARGFIRRTPNKYFHLIERGFTHRSGQPVAGYHWRKRTADAVRDEVLTIFKERLQVAITVAIAKHTYRASRDASQP
jgi:hypothetical protein